MGPCVGFFPLGGVILAWGEGRLLVLSGNVPHLPTNVLPFSGPFDDTHRRPLEEANLQIERVGKKDNRAHYWTGQVTLSSSPPALP